MFRRTRAVSNPKKPAEGTLDPPGDRTVDQEEGGQHRGVLVQVSPASPERLASERLGSKSSSRWVRRKERESFDLRPPAHRRLSPGPGRYDAGGGRPAVSSGLLPSALRAHAAVCCGFGRELLLGNDLELVGRAG